MNDALHRILSGSPARRAELIAAGLFVAIWFAMDVVQFADWTMSKFGASATCTLVLPNHLDHSETLVEKPQ